MLDGQQVAIEVGEVSRKEVRLSVHCPEGIGAREERPAARQGSLDAAAQEGVVERLVAAAEDAERDGRSLRPERLGDEIAARVREPHLGAGGEIGRRRLHVRAEDPRMSAPGAGGPARGQGHTWDLVAHGGALSHTSKWSGARRHRVNLPW